VPRYAPKQAPVVNDRELQLVVRWLEDELREIAASIEVPEFEVVRFATLHSALPKPRNGDHVRADGSDWDPGSGEGEYEYKGGAWSKL
jgi:hypothetical protein